MIKKDKLMKILNQIDADHRKREFEMEKRETLRRKRRKGDAAGSPNTNIVP